ncbi:Type II secretion system protein F [Hyphomicrobiales bacterium]|jgi:type II secretory pathway component PulF|nr:Type II secretion system protein F [Hyphomicrobiales bacterium]CAH1702591.1 Type II secretion system (T2SS), F family protein [Hyphomicrobiales bacterium]CAI0346794.1 Type II secretion system protein F [Hyphomicrobiales bacterium]
MTSFRNLEEAFIRFQFGGKDRLRIYRKLARLQRNRVTMTESLKTMWRHESNEGKKPKKPAAIALDAWRRRVENGKSIGDAMEGWVPESDRTIIRAGEKAGSLPEALDDAIFIHIGQKRIRTALIIGISYPFVIFCALITLLVIVGTNVIPSFSTIVPRERWTGSGAMLAYIADFVEVGLIPSLVGLVVLTLVILWSMPRWTGRARVYADRFPPYALYRLVRGSGFLLSFATMVKSGIKTTEALRIMIRGTSPWMKERLTKALAIMNDGTNIGDALYRSRMEFPDREVVLDLRTYASLDKFDEALTTIGRENLEETVTRIERSSAVMRNVCIGLLAAAFGMIVGGIFSLQSQITSTF